jgi:predicted transposase/invertase (TIGR01784 family)
MARFIDPKTDFGFKRLFGQEDSKDILKQFLFDVLNLSHPIIELSYIPSEQLPATPAERSGVYDVYCTDAVGQRFIVEMQRGFQLFIKDRILFYATFPIIHQARKGFEWEFSLLPIYCIAILNFTLDDGVDQYLRRVQLLDIATHEVFYEKLTFVYIELPKFDRSVELLTTNAERWIYLLKYMPELQDIPAELASESFSHAFEIAREAALSPRERLQYEVSLKQARDQYATLMSARYQGLEEGRAEGLAEGLAEGRAEGRAEGHKAGLEEGQRQRAEEIARSMLARGMDKTLIGEVTGLPADVIQALASSRPAGA